MKKIILYTLFVLFTLPGLAQVERKVIIEHYTNTRCGICSFRNPGFYQTLEDYPQVLHIAYHPSAPYATCVFNQHNPAENDARTNFYDIYGGTPRAVIQGEVVPGQSQLIKPEQIDAKLGQQSDYQVMVTKMLVSGNTYKVKIQINKISGGSGSESFQLYAGLAEKTINYSAPNGEDVHHDVFRKNIYDQSVTLDGEGDSKTIEIEYSNNPEWVEDEMFAYAILQDATTKEVEQTSSSLDSPSFIDNSSAEEIKSLFYPNPATNVVNLRQEYLNKFDRIELFSFVGNRIAEFGDAPSLNISDLPAGMYFIVATSSHNERFTSRLIVND